MKIKTKLIASVLALATIASVPALTAFASYQTCKNFVDNQEFSVDFGTTQECILRDIDQASTMPLVYLSCNATNNIGSSETVHSRSGYYQSAKLNVYISFIDSKGNIILSDTQTGTEVNFSEKNISNKSSATTVEEGHILIYCKGYKQTGASNYTPVNTYVNYGFGYN